MDTSTYYRAFIGRLVNGGIPAATSKELNALLHWLAGRDNDAARLIQNAFDSYGVAVEVARRQTLAYLDRTLFSQPDDYHRVLSLSPHSNVSEVRSRHKQLLQVFHPDRHVEDRDWFTERTEQLNRAYACLKANHARHPTSDRVPTGQSARTQVERQRQRPVAKPGLWKQVIERRHLVRQKLKTHLGSAQRFERRLYVVLYSVPVTLLLLIALNHLKLAEPHEMQTDPATELAKTEQPDGTVTKNQHEGADISKTVLGVADGKSVDELRLPSIRESSSESIHPRGIEPSGRAGFADTQVAEDREMSPNGAQASWYLSVCEFFDIGKGDLSADVEEKLSNRWRYSYNGTGSGLQDHDFAAQRLEGVRLYPVTRNEQNTWPAMTLCK